MIPLSKYSTSDFLLRLSQHFHIGFSVHAQVFLSALQATTSSTYYLLIKISVYQETCTQ